MDRGSPYPLADLDRRSPYPLADLDQGGPNRWDTGVGKRIVMFKGFFAGNLFLIKTSLVGGSKSARGDPYPLADLDRGSKSAGVRIRSHTGMTYRVI